MVSAGNQHSAGQLYVWKSAVNDKRRNSDRDRNWVDPSRKKSKIIGMSKDYRVGDAVQVYLNENWFDGVIVRIEPYSENRSFHWVELDDVAQAILGMKQISVFNPKNIRKT